MKRAILVHGWNKKNGKFLIYISDSNNIKKTLGNATVSISYNNTSKLTFTIFPNNDAFTKLLPIKTDIILIELEAGIEKQIFTGIVMNVKSFSDKEMNIGKEVYCVSSHAFFVYRPIRNDRLSKTNNNSDGVFSLNGNDPNVAVVTMLDACTMLADLDRYKYLPEKNIFHDTKWNTFSETYSSDKTLGNGPAIIITDDSFYTIWLIIYIINRGIVC